MNHKRELLFLKPCMKHVVWGGNKLRDEFGYEDAGDSTGECWGISAHPNGDCLISSGRFAGMTLSKLYAEHRELFGNITAEEFPLLVKILDSKQGLSIQVHPDDTYAKTHEGGRGKAECWYIIDCPENASLVIGHHAKNRDELKKLIEEGKYEELIREVPVKKGDFIQIDPGTLHAIRGGFTILETQQNSDITYRVYDYGRKVNGKERELHVKQSMEVITVPAKPVADLINRTEDFSSNQMHLLVDNAFFKVWKAEVKSMMKVNQEHPFLLASVIKGAGSVDGHAVKKADHFVVPAGYGEILLKGDMELIMSTI